MRLAPQRAWPYQPCVNKENRHGCLHHAGMCACRQRLRGKPRKFSTSHIQHHSQVLAEGRIMRFYVVVKDRQGHIHRAMTRAPDQFRRQISAATGAGALLLRHAAEWRVRARY